MSMLRIVAAVAALIAMLPACRHTAAPLRPPTDASGMAWVAGDTFLVVHDAKRADEHDRPRISIVALPRSADGMRWTPLEVRWPASSGPSHDLEAVARIPGTPTYLLAESGDDESGFRRIFRADLSGDRLRIRDVVPWPVAVANVEGMAVARVSGALVFVYAERAHGRPHTDLAWASLTLDPPAFGPFESVRLPATDPAGPDARPVSALAVDAAGRLYAASALDPERDDGPFRSVIWAVGMFEPGPDGRPRLVLGPEPERLATLDGLKVESLAVRERSPGLVELFVGTDDEHYGAVIRPLPR